MLFVPGEYAHSDESPDFYVVVGGGEILCRDDAAWAPQPRDLVEQSFPHLTQKHYLGVYDGGHCFAAFVNKQEREACPSGYQWVHLRGQLGLIPDNLFQLAGRALQVTRWHRDHQYCGACGNKTQASTIDRALVCEPCDAHYYPRISPCVIGLIKRGDQCLLARGVRLPEGLYSTLAGFIEPGESAEDAFAREVKEEVGLSIANISYVGSQPWPFPGQLMLAYTADYLTGEITPDTSEIVEAGWFSADNLPMVPPAETIAGTLIRQFVHNSRRNS